MKTAPLFSGYTLHEDGTVVSRFGRAVAHQISREGYVRVELWSGGKGRKYLLHRLLAEAFVDNPDGKPHVNHIDGVKRNNAIANLEWTTQSENQLHAYRNGLQRGYKKSAPISEDHKRALCGSRWKVETHVYLLDGFEFHNLWEASAHFGVSRQTVLNRCKSTRWPAWSKTIERRENA